MKKIVLSILVLMLAGPAMAIDCNFMAVQEGTTGVVQIWYDANSPPGKLPRAFSLDITVDNGQTIDAVSGLSAEYWVYPGSIDINDAGEVNDVGTPVADPCDLPSDTEQGLGYDGITVEMGSLYVGAANAPDPCAMLLKVTVSSDCNLTITGNVGRGKAVLEGATQALTNLPITLMVSPVTPAGFTISGTVSGKIADGVTISGLPNSPIVTAGGGLYTDTVPSGWNGTVTPSATNITFRPASIAYTNVLANQASQDYTACDFYCEKADFTGLGGDYSGVGDGTVNLSESLYLSFFYGTASCLGHGSPAACAVCDITGLGGDYTGVPDDTINISESLYLSFFYGTNCCVP